MIIAIDGPAAAGKGTLGRRLAERFDLAYLDTGLLYRAVAAKLLGEGGAAGDAAAAEAVARGLAPEDLQRPGLRDEAVSLAASQVAAVTGVREALRGFQRDFAHSPPEGRAGAVLDGRDIGTVVCPEADVKLFVTAGLEARAERRHKELLARGEASIYADVLREMRERDARDSGRAASPLKPAEDSIVLDTTEMDIETAFAVALDVVSVQGGAGRP